VNTFVFKPRFARRLPDPSFNSTHGSERHIFFVSIAELPAGISLEPGPRNPSTRWDIYKEVQASLLDIDCTPGTFHLKNSGITIFAKDVRKIDEDEYEVEIGPGHGVVDGYHTYQLINESQRNPNIELPRQQYVKVEILTGLPDDWILEISLGLNASMQSQSNNLSSLTDALQWLKDELKNESYFKSIAWSENERAACDVRDILCAITCFNTIAYPNSGSAHPVVTYEKKPVVLSSFEEDFKSNEGKAYRRLRPIVKDILTLHDTIQLEFPVLCERSDERAPELIEKAKKKPHEFVFLQTRSTERLARGALYPILAAFRWMVEDNPKTGQVGWRGGFKAVLNRWHETGSRLVAQTIDKSREVGRNPDAIGKSASHWGAMHKEVAFVDLMAQKN
jgi:hypothetical protein